MNEPQPAEQSGSNRWLSRLSLLVTAEPVSHLHSARRCGCCCMSVSGLCESACWLWD